MFFDHPEKIVTVVAEPYGPFDSLLDLGTGGGILALSSWNIPHDRIHTLDIFPPETPWRNFTLGDALDAEKIFGPKSFDVVQAAEILEHLPKEKGPELLAVCERVARKLVIVTTPNGFLEQDPALHPEEGWAKNPYQKHLCGWETHELEALGYEARENGAPGSTSGHQIIAWKVLSGTRE
jgi:hypothetical protein